MTAHLAGLGVDASGVDLSPGMVEVARRRHPELAFDVGAMPGLPRAAGSLAGVLAWYSLIHTPPARLPAVCVELASLLAPGGHLLVGFHVGEGPRELTRAYGHPVRCTVWSVGAEQMAGLLGDAGLQVTVVLHRAAEGDEKGPQGAVLARR